MLVPPSLLSAISLFHPAGLPVTTRVLGQDCPAPDQAAPAGPAEVVVMAAVGANATRPDQLAPLVARLAGALAPEGVGYLLTRPGARPRLRALLGAQGLLVVEERLHLPIWSASLALVPNQRGPVRYALNNLIPKLSLRARLAAAAGRRPGGAALLAGLLPVIGWVVRRPSGRPLFDWLFQLGGDINPHSAILVRTGWRETEGVTVLYAMTPHQPNPTTVVKIGPAHHALHGEVRRMAALTPLAQQAGAWVPRALGLTQWPDRHVLRQTAGPGQLAATLLTTHPRQLGPVLTRLVAWLESWNRATRWVTPLTAAQLQTEVLGPAAALAPHLPGAAAYLAWLTRQCAAALGRPVPLVATHNDLTMWNVLISGRAGVGIVDWESGRAVGLPLTDLVYAVVDAVAAAEAYRDRLAAFTACMAPGSAPAARLAGWLGRLGRALALPPDLTALCCQAAWLQHAANELAAATPGAPRPFLHIVQWLAARPEPHD